jgi:streptomycin 6-kinase
VWRLPSGSGSVIVKRGSDTQAAEADTYEQLVRPLDLPAPELFHLDRAMELAASALAELHRDVPTAVVHGDLVPKNLVTDGSRWTAVDWPAAYRTPHLGDLHSLLRDARTGGFATDPIVARQIDAAGTAADLVRRQLVLGGVCFSVLALCWIVEEGLRTVPPSKDWIDGPLTELDDLTGALR